MSYVGTITGPYWKKEARIGCGTIFKLTPPAVGHPLWAEAVLYRFQGGDGRYATGVPLMDKTGVLYGVTAEGGGGGCGYLSSIGSLAYQLKYPTGCGTVFKLTPPAAGQNTWDLTTLYAFEGKPDGAFPDGGVIFNADGSLIGTTDGALFSNLFVFSSGFHPRSGTVFQLSPPASGSTVWTQTNLYHGDSPRGPLYRGPDGALFGTAGGVANYTGAYGIVFQLTPPASGATVWTQAILYALSLNPTSGLIRDAATAAFYGVTGVGGGTCGGECGSTVFSLKPPIVGKTKWTEAVLHRFVSRPHDGANPQAGLALDKAGNVYGTTSGGGAHLFGTVFKVSP
jgi:uncharacterized repeat protein (TIGR03803 family)